MCLQVLNHDPAYSHLAAFSAQPKKETMPSGQDLLAVEPDAVDASQSLKQKISATAAF